MPVRSRSCPSNPAMKSRASAAELWSRSSSGSAPSRMKPPSREVGGGSSTNVALRSASTSTGGTAVPASPVSSPGRSSRRRATAGSAAHASRMAPRSRGVARPWTARPTSLSRSRTDPSRRRSSSRRGRSATRAATASRRAPIGLGLGERLLEAAAEQAGPHRRPGAVEELGQAGPAAQRLQQLEVAPGRRVEAHQVAALPGDDPEQARLQGDAGALAVAEDRSRGTDPHRHLLEPETEEAGGAGRRGEPLGRPAGRRREGPAARSGPRRGGAPGAGMPDRRPAARQRRDAPIRRAAPPSRTPRPPPSPPARRRPGRGRPRPPARRSRRGRPGGRRGWVPGDRRPQRCRDSARG